MIKSLDEINRLLFIFDQYDLDVVSEDALLKYMSGSPIVSQSALDHRATIKFCLLVGILKEKQGGLGLTTIGKRFARLALEKNPSHLMDFNKRQCDSMNSDILLNPQFNSPIHETLRDYFERDDYSKSWKYDYSENPPLPSEFMGYVDLLKQCGLLLEHDGLYEVDPRYSPAVSVLLAEKPSLSQEELDKILERQKRTGSVAEELIVNYEREILKDQECFEEAELVTKVSDWDTAAGYDVKSFSGPSRTKRHDKFIEVKGSTDRRVRFIWSANEIEQARRLGKNYWLYFLGGIGKEERLHPLKFQDPCRSILRSDKFNKRCVGYEITAVPRREKPTSAAGQVHKY